MGAPWWEIGTGDSKEKGERMTTALATIFVLGVLVFLHELGHFTVAKLVGIRVERFSLGFPPRLFGVKIGETDYCVSLIPLGGYVKMAGMVDESLDTHIQGEPWEFQSKNFWQKTAVILAGPVMNYLLAIVIFAGLTLSLGVGVTKDATISQVSPGMPAQAAGIQPGDKIVAINGHPIKTWDEMTQLIHGNPDKDITVVWVHNGERRTAVIHTKAENVPIGGKIERVGLIGIAPKTYLVKVSPFKAIEAGWTRTWELTELVGNSLVMLVTGKASLRNLGGPIIIAKMAGESAKSGFSTLLAFMAFISLNLAILNILPIPGLDGGHMIFIVTEAIIGKPVPTKTKLIVQQVGMFILLALIVLVVFNDLHNIHLIK